MLPLQLYIFHALITIAPPSTTFPVPSFNKSLTSLSHRSYFSWRTRGTHLPNGSWLAGGTWDPDLPTISREPRETVLPRQPWIPWSAVHPWRSLDPWYAAITGRTWEAVGSLLAFGAWGTCNAWLASGSTPSLDGENATHNLNYKFCVRIFNKIH